MATVESSSTGLMYIDCHCHLADKDFDQDLEAVIQSSKQSGVRAALVCGTAVSEFQKVIDIADKFPDFVVPCLGVHPVQGALTGEQRSVNLQDLEEAIPWIEKYHERLGAIGEVGLDFQPRITKSTEDKEVQKEVLCKQIELAKQFKLPLNVHSRSAGRPTITLLKEQEAQAVLLHAFDGNPKVALQGIQEGYYFSIPPSIVRSEQKQKLVKSLPIDNLLLETDSPALGPEKQVRNVPGNIQISCKYIADTKGVDVSYLSKHMIDNTVKLFPKLAKFVHR